jgi:peptidyl-prolyl cis-trans isomerase SurA
MRTIRLHQIKSAAVLLCALAAGSAGAQGPVKAPAPAAAKPGSGFLPPAASSANVIDSIYVVVNDEVITRNEVNQRVRGIEQRMRAQGTQMPDADNLRRQVVEAMIVERAQMQLAKEMGVKVDDRRLDATIARIAEGQKMSVQEMRNQMEKEGMTYPVFREEIRGEIMLQQLREHEVDRKIQVSDAEVDTYLGAEKAAAADKVEMDIAQILVGIPANASPEQIAARKARADDVLRQLRIGADFAKMAATYSDAPDALKGGAIGWRDPDRLPPLFASELRKLKPGQVTSVIKSNTGFHIIKMANVRSVAPEAAQSVIQQTRVRHILIKVTPTVTAEDAQRKLAEIKQRIDSKSATFEEQARLFSNDSSASKGGDLGWMVPGDTSPEFEGAMDALKPGEVSGVIKTEYGYHIMQVIERKSEDVTKEKARNQARQVIRDRKLQEAAEDWARQVRDRAYVEFREES